MYKHIAKSGKQQGQWVSCPAVLNCRNGGFHVPQQEVNDATRYFNWKKRTGEEKFKVATISAEKVFTYMNLPEAEKNAFQSHEDLKFARKYGSPALSGLNLDGLVPKERWDLAKKLLRRDGIKFRDNVQKCCRGCIMPEDLGMNESDPYAYTYGGQGNRISWDQNGKPVSKTTTRSRRGYRNYDDFKPYGEIYINHGNNAAPKIVEMLQRVGINASWDGNEYSCVIVNIE